MSKPGSLTKNPTLLTAVLSLATLAGYAAYRFTLGTGSPTAAEQRAGDEAGHAHESASLADTLPDIVLANLDGTPRSLSSFAGEPLLINFWATWCAPCLREIPLLKTFQDEHPSIGVLGIAVHDPEDALPFAAEMDFNYPVVAGLVQSMSAMAAFRNLASALPFSVYVDADGAILGTHTGELHAEHLEHLAATVAALRAGTIGRAEARERLATAH
jgi:thiol-disulfide isomerase/thioredoxin